VTCVPLLACQAISNGPQQLQVLHTSFVIIHKKYYWPWLVQKYWCSWHIEWSGILNWHTFTKGADPRFTGCYCISVVQPNTNTW